MKTVVFTHVSDDWFEPIGARKMIASFKRFHPDIPFVVYTSKDIDPVLKAGWNWDTLMAPLGKTFAGKYDLVVHIDADSVVLGPLDEILRGDYTLGGVLDASQTREKTHAKYLNCGLIAVRDKKFWDLWAETNRAEAAQCFWGEQDIWNKLFAQCPSTRIFDESPTSPWYGLSSDLHCFNKPLAAEVTLRGNEMIFHGRPLRIIHHAGGHALPKLDFENWPFTPDVRKRLYKIIGPKTSPLSVFVNAAKHVARSLRATNQKTA